MVDSATPQAGVFAGLNPSKYNSQDPVVLFIIQAAIILIFCRVLAVPLAWLKQPRVISEVLTGIILGPSVMGRIPGYMNALFPPESLPGLNLISTLGLIFFLFQVGLEVDLRIVRKDWRKSVSVAIAGMILPFGLGSAVSVGLYRLQNQTDVPFGIFLLFLGVSMSITAFPVLARILAELKLLRTKVGAITMAAGLLNDCTAWVLLALVVALMNSSGGLEALWVFLTVVGFALFLIFIVGPLYRRLCVYTGSLEHGPSPLLMAVTLLIVLVSAFVTDIIGVHPIFGGFLAGVIVPHEGDLAIKITEKIEDIVNIIFLPLYFTLSGLKTQIGLLNTGTVWGYVILVIIVACFGKITGCTVAARACGMTTRESFAVGFLMNCKGLVELIVLNIGHDAKVLDDQIFVIMVVMALITTFMTTPMVMWLYPRWYQKQRAEGSEQSTTSLSMADDIHKESSIMPSESALAEKQLHWDKFCLVTMLNRIDTVPSMMALIRLLQKDVKVSKWIEIHALRLLELTQRASDVMKIQDMRETERHDSVLNVLRTFASLIGISLHTQLDFCAPSDYVKTVISHGHNVGADMILFPWLSLNKGREAVATTPGATTEESYFSSGILPTADYELAMSAFNQKSQLKFTVGLFIDRGFGLTDGDPTSFQIIVPFLGGADDRAALLFALRLQVDRQAKVLVLQQSIHQSKSVTYSSPDSIRAVLEQPPKTDAELIGTLFHDAEQTQDVACQWTGSSDQASTSATPNTLMVTHMPLPLGKHDLIVLGRRFGVSAPPPSMTPADTPSHVTQYGKEFKHILGLLAYDLLSSGPQASMVVIQAAKEEP